MIYILMCKVCGALVKEELAAKLDPEERKIGDLLEKIALHWATCPNDVPRALKVVRRRAASLTKSQLKVLVHDVGALTVTHSC